LDRRAEIVHVGKVCREKGFGFFDARLGAFHENVAESASAIHVYVNALIGSA
jgi:hypothetical protein